MATSYAVGPGPSQINGHEYAETIYGTGAGKTIRGFGGGDYLAGLSGHDAIYGGSGDDLVRGDGGYDSLRRGTGSDRILGGSGNDTVYSTGDGGVGDVVDCGAGYNTAIADRYDKLKGCEVVERSSYRNFQPFSPSTREHGRARGLTKARPRVPAV